MHDVSFVKELRSELTIETGVTLILLTVILYIIVRRTLEIISSVIFAVMPETCPLSLSAYAHTA
jgi:hypothetical protein